jgi:hypothetical protein
VTFNAHGDYEIHKLIRSADARADERRLDHVRARRERQFALEDVERQHGFVNRIALHLLPGLRAMGTRPASRPDGHELTSVACRLADGRTGRVAVSPSGEGWVAVCVAA